MSSGICCDVLSVFLKCDAQLLCLVVTPSVQKPFIADCCAMIGAECHLDQFKLFLIFFIRLLNTIVRLEYTYRMEVFGVVIFFAFFLLFLVFIVVPIAFFRRLVRKVHITVLVTVF